MRTSCLQWYELIINQPRSLRFLCTWRYGGLLNLLGLSALMAITSFLPGLLPLYTLTPSKSRLITSTGTGLLVGTSLIVIIPEGVDTLYNANAIDHAHIKSAYNSSTPEKAPGYFRTSEARSEENYDQQSASRSTTPSAVSTPILEAAFNEGAEGLEIEKSWSNSGRDEPDPHKDQFRSESPHAWIGFALISGFILMFMIDNVPQHARFSKLTCPPHHISLNDLGRGLSRARSSSNDDGEASWYLPASSLEPGQSRGLSISAGLVIHGAADGVALGASSFSANNGLSFIIFFAIMIHKAPTAFGLASVLLKQGLSKKTTRAHLLFFSLAAPTGAIMTWFFAHFVGSSTVESTQSTQWWTAILLLFSAGTFLYVAIHTMQGLGSLYQVQVNDRPNRVSESIGNPGESREKSIKELVFAVIGMAMPLFLQLGHAH